MHIYLLILHTVLFGFVSLIIIEYAIIKSNTVSQIAGHLLISDI